MRVSGEVRHKHTKKSTHSALRINRSIFRNAKRSLMKLGINLERAQQLSFEIIQNTISEGRYRAKLRCVTLSNAH